MFSSNFINTAKISALLLFIFPLGAAVAFARPASVFPQDDQQEIWEGTLDHVTYKLRLVLKVSKAGDRSFKATLVSLDQGNKEFPIHSLAYEDSFVHFELPEIEASFTGGLSRDGSEIAGRWRQGNEGIFHGGLHQRKDFRMQSAIGEGR
jgi:hypothetical protein